MLPEQESLKNFVERIERLEDEKAAIASDIGDIYRDAKSTGFEPKVMRELIKLRKKEPRIAEAEDELLAIYKQALGMEPG